MATLPVKKTIKTPKSNFFNSLSDMSNEDMMGYADAGLDAAGNIVGAVVADEGHKGEGTGKAIGGGIGTAAGALIGGPLGAQVGGKLGSMVGGLIGHGSDVNNQIASDEEQAQRNTFNQGVGVNINPYGQYEEGGLVTDGPTVDKQTYATAKNEYYRILQKEGKNLSVSNDELKLRQQSHRILLDNMRFYEKGGKWTTEPLKDAAFQIGNTARSFGNQLLGTHFEEGGMAGADMMQEQYGGEPDMMQQQAPTTMQINVEKGELLSDTDGNIVQEFTNPNRYSPHADSQFKEPMGNFVETEKGHIVIPKKLATRFKNGDILTRRSILRKLVDQQIQDPTINEPKGASTDRYAAGGYVPGPGDELPDPLADILPYANGLPNTGVRVTAEGPKAAPLPNFTNDKQGPTLNGAVNAATGKTGSIMTNDLPTEVGGAATLPAEANTQGRQLDYGMVGRRLGSKLPALFQTINAMQGDPYLKPVYNHGIDPAKSNLMQIDDSLNVNDQIAAIDESASMALEGIANNNTPSARAEAAAVVAKANEAKGQVMANVARSKTAVRNNKLAQLAQLEMQGGQSDQAENIRVQTEQRMNAANDQNIVANALSENYRMDAGWQNDMEKIKMLNEVSKFENIDIMAKQKLYQDPDALNYVFNSIATGSAASLLQAMQQYEMNKAKNAKTPTKASTPKSK